VQYIILTAWGYHVLKDSPIMPWFMGGTSDAETAFEGVMKGVPWIKTPDSIYSWFLYSQGHYWAELFNHIFILKR